MSNENDLVYRLRKRSEIRKQITSRKSVREGAPDRISELLEEAADEIERLRQCESDLGWYKRISEKEWPQ